MPTQTLHPVPEKFAKTAHINLHQYHEMYQRSIKDPNTFWGEEACKFTTWFQPWETVLTGNFNQLNVEWFKNGKLNACYNCIDRHLPHKANQIAILWEGDDAANSLSLTYKQLFEKICRFANVLKKFGVKKGDRVAIYLPMIPEAVIAILACARIGAIHNVVFGGFSPDSLRSRILDADCRIVVTANEGLRGGKLVPLKKNLDEALDECPNVKHVIVVKHTKNTCNWNPSRDHWYAFEMEQSSSECPCEIMDANDPLYILYTSGSTGKPKGILHTTGGYLVYVASTFYYVFDYHDNDIYWSTADVGWVTGHSYTVYGPLCNGATVLIYEGVPNHPTSSRIWEIVDKYKVNILYTAPTALRALRQQGDEWVTKTNRSSLKILGTVGEPINPDVWEWYFNVVGNKKCQIVDTWWQTETGGMLITPLPGVTPLKAGSATWAFFGIVPAIFDEEGKEVPKNKMGKLVITKPWPGMMKTVYGDNKRFKDNYFSEYPGNYLTGDEARCDEENYYWIAGRNDDVLKISGHRIGTGELENAFLTHESVAEAAVVGIPHDIKGESIYAFITLKSNVEPTNQLKQELIMHIRNSIGAIATPDFIQWANALPKTRSGKIMRRILRKIANHDFDSLGDTSTLADPQVVDELIKERR